MLHLLPTIRVFSYLAFAFWCFLTFILSASFIGKTESDFAVYFGGAALLLASSLLGFGLLGLHFAIHRRGVATTVGSLAVETGVVGLLWVLFLAGAADLSSSIPAGIFCSGTICGLARATQAFGWLSWITLSVILVNLIITGLTSGTASWKAPYGAERVEASKEGKTTTTTSSAPAPIGAAPAQPGMAQV